MQALPAEKRTSVLLLLFHAATQPDLHVQANWEAIKALALDTSPAPQLMPSTPSHDPNQSAAQVRVQHCHAGIATCLAGRCLSWSP